MKVPTIAEIDAAARIRRAEILLKLILKYLTTGEPLSDKARRSLIAEIKFYLSVYIEEGKEN